jgi:hypothetical protein
MTHPVNPPPCLIPEIGETHYIVAGDDGYHALWQALVTFHVDPDQIRYSLKVKDTETLSNLVVELKKRSYLEVPQDMCDTKKCITHGEALMDAREVFRTWILMHSHTDLRTSPLLDCMTHTFYIDGVELPTRLNYIWDKGCVVKTEIELWHQASREAIVGRTAPIEVPFEWSSNLPLLQDLTGYRNPPSHIPHHIKWLTSLKASHRAAVVQALAERLAHFEPSVPRPQSLSEDASTKLVDEFNTKLQARAETIVSAYESLTL